MENQMEQRDSAVGNGLKGRLTLVDGVFDPLHNGHIAYFKAAYDLGYPVICNISPNRKRMPLLTMHERASIIGNTRWVSDVTFRGTEAALSEMDIRYYAKGSDWIGKLPQTQLDTCKERGIEIVYTITTRNSSSEIIRNWMGTVDGFEAAINEQKEPEPWTNTYTLKERRKIEGRHPQLIKEVFDPSYVLDMGCGPGILVMLLREIGVFVVGVDNQFEGPWIDKGDICTHQVAGSYDLVICREVLEHLPVLKVQKAVESLCRLTTKFVYVTTRFSNDGFFRVGTELDVDPTHISCLDKDMLRLMFVLQGMRRRADLEERMDWMNKGRVLVYEKA